MNESRTRRSESTTDRVLGCLAHETRRETVAVLRDRTTAVSVEELAAVVVARRDERPVADVPEADRTSVAVQLSHAHLPALADADLVDWTPGEETVALTDHPALDDEQLAELLSADAAIDDWDALIRSLADARRRHLVSTLENAEGTVERRALARRVAAREADEARSAVSEPTVDTVETSLYHVHLPALRRCGLVETDGETVTYDGHSEFDASWVSIDLASPGEMATPGAAESGTRDESGTVERPQTTFDEAGD
ncbi:hypothetical protein HWV07_03565 [Natronomonas salina]|uniref:DUF7344 domain-containing protein n=1 Tax=Natronomonas salina TaxID=1710540 RepID=UPI0015B5E7FC|nr:hypothetical protein [Natronomonas salina]QLD88161.1 hypothetical protein HWV07_03565 [Natronomonas salina]